MGSFFVQLDEHRVIGLYQGGVPMNNFTENTEKPSKEALLLAYEFIITNILPRMIEGEKAKGNL